MTRRWLVLLSLHLSTYLPSLPLPLYNKGLRGLLGISLPANSTSMISDFFMRPERQCLLVPMPSLSLPFRSVIRKTKRKCCAVFHFLHTIMHNDKRATPLMKQRSSIVDSPATSHDISSRLSAAVRQPRSAQAQRRKKPAPQRHCEH